MAAWGGAGGDESGKELGPADPVLNLGSKLRRTGVAVAKGDDFQGRFMADEEIGEFGRGTDIFQVQCF